MVDKSNYACLFILSLSLIVLIGAVGVVVYDVDLQENMEVSPVAGVNVDPAGEDKFQVTIIKLNNVEAVYVKGFGVVGDSQGDKKTFKISNQTEGKVIVRGVSTDGWVFTIEEKEIT